MDRARAKFRVFDIGRGSGHAGEHCHWATLRVRDAERVMVSRRDFRVRGEAAYGTHFHFHFVDVAVKAGVRFACAARHAIVMSLRSPPGPVCRRVSCFADVHESHPSRTVFQVKRLFPPFDVALYPVETCHGSHFAQWW